MPPPATAAEPLNIRERIIVALDVPVFEEARSIVAELGDGVGAFKIGMQLFTAAGPDFVRELAGRGTKIFLDLKYHDIPNTVAAASLEAAKMGVWMFNIHATGGSEMMRRAVETVEEYCERTQARKPLMIAVTMLTSFDASTLVETGVTDGTDEHVSRLARLAYGAGLNGVVSSPREVSLVKKAVADERFITVTPGIRGLDATFDDQRRVTTIGAAFAGGSDFVVIGRPILSAPDRRSAVEKLIEEAR